MFYTYLWLRYDGTPYYVGKGCRGRAWLDCIGHHPPDENHILIQEFVSEEEAVAAEVFLIAYYGRKDLGTGILINLTDGGDGVSGMHHTKETRIVIGLKSKGHKEPSEVTEKRAAKLRGLKRSPEFCAARSAEAKVRTYSPETRAKMRAAKLGTTVSVETRSKMRAAHVGHNVSEETRQKIGATKFGILRTPETIAKMTGWHHTPESRAKMKATKAAKKLQAV